MTSTKLLPAACCTRERIRRCVSANGSLPLPAACSFARPMGEAHRDRARRRELRPVCAAGAVALQRVPEAQRARPQLCALKHARPLRRRRRELLLASCNVLSCPNSATSMVVSLLRSPRCQMTGRNFGTRASGFRATNRPGTFAHCALLCKRAPAPTPSYIRKNALGWKVAMLPLALAVSAPFRWDSIKTCARFILPVPFRAIRALCRCPLHHFVQFSASRCIQHNVHKTNGECPACVSTMTR